MVALDVGNASLHVESQGHATRLDLSGVGFILPGGIVALACAARAALDAGHDVDVVAPRSDDASRYASRMGLGDVLATYGVTNPLPAVNHHDRTKVLVECHWADDSTIGGVSDLVNDRLYEAGVDPVITDLVAMAVYEVADNVQAHAGAHGGFVCAQTYELGTADERVEVAIGDVGCGIRSTLEARYTVPTDEAALRMAVTENVSGIDRRRGLGLHYVARDIPRAGGRLTLRSGAAILQVHPGGPYGTSCAPVAGTLVAIRVPVGKMSVGGNR